MRKSIKVFNLLQWGCEFQAVIAIQKINPIYIFYHLFVSLKQKDNQKQVTHYVANKNCFLFPPFPSAPVKCNFVKKWHTIFFSIIDQKPNDCRHFEVLHCNYNGQKTKFGHNFWLEGPIDLRPTYLNCIFKIFSGTPQIWPNMHFWRIFGRAKWSSGVSLKRTCKMQ